MLQMILGTIYSPLSSSGPAEEPVSPMDAKLFIWADHPQQHKYGLETHRVYGFNL